MGPATELIVTTVLVGMAFGAVGGTLFGVILAIVNTLWGRP